MKIDFGFKKVAIYTGTLKANSKIGVCELQKLLEEYNPDKPSDIPVTIHFHSVRSLEVLIHALEGLRMEMIENEEK